MGKTKAGTECNGDSGRVLIKRWPDSYSLIGPPVIVKDLEDAAESLVLSTWMRPWLITKVREALLAGEVLEQKKRILDEDGSGWRGREDGVVAEWRLATHEEILNYVDTAKFESTTGHQPTRRAQEKGYILHYRESVTLEDAYYLLPKQAKAILDMLKEANRGTFSEAAIVLIVTEKAAALSTRQEPGRVWGFYRSRFVAEGHLEKIKEEG